MTSKKTVPFFLFNISLDNVVEMLEDSAIVPCTLFEIYWVILHNMGHICKIADSSQLIFSLLLFLLKALMCAFFRAPIHDFVDLLIRQQFALTNNSMMTPLWMNPPVAPKLKGNLLRGIDNKIVKRKVISIVYICSLLSSTPFIRKQNNSKLHFIYNFFPKTFFWIETLNGQNCL